jgi:hypothetical protein
MLRKKKRAYPKIAVSLKFLMFYLDPKGAKGILNWFLCKNGIHPKKQYI